MPAVFNTEQQPGERLQGVNYKGEKKVIDSLRETGSLEVLARKKHKDSVTTLLQSLSHNDAFI